MTHTVCGQSVTMKRVLVVVTPEIWAIVPFCPKCQRCIDAIEELADDTPVSPGRPWELDPDE